MRGKMTYTALPITSYSNCWRPESSPFKDRKHAGKLLGDKLIEKYGDKLRNSVCFGCLRGGLQVAQGVTEAIKSKEIFCELDYIIIRKLGLPSDKDYGIGAMEDDGTAFFLEDVVKKNNVDVSSEVMLKQIEYERKELQRRKELFPKNKVYESSSFENRTVVLIDECGSSGATMIAAIRSIQKTHKAAYIIVALPVASKTAQNRIVELTQLSPENICIWEIPNVPKDKVWSTNDFFENHRKATDEDVLEILNEAVQSLG